MADEIIVVANGSIRHRGDKEAILPLILAVTRRLSAIAKEVFHQMNKLTQELNTIDEIDAELLGKNR